MADNAVTTPNLPVANTPPLATDRIVFLANAAGNVVTSTVSLALLANAMVSANLITIPNFTPANSSANGVQSQITYDASFIYVAVANNTWKRVAIATW